MYYNAEEPDFTQLKYVLYARKSTDDPKKQVRSIKDQISDCKEYANRLGLKVVGRPVIEKRSAKKPNERPLFRQMIKDLNSGKYDGVLTWHPDRLARNMKEGGEIIDMIDEGKIKDLKFVTHHFSNNPQGKMILGLSFVLSKQYSDDLSEKITRGTRKSFAEGKAWTPKHGYLNEDHVYKPDGRNYELIVEAWKMRVRGDTLEAIVEYLDINGYYRQFKKSRKKIKLQKSSLSKLFKDPFYYGAMVQAKQTVDLTALYGFQPATTEDQYNSVQKAFYTGRKPNQQSRLVFYPLKRMVLCSYCKKECVVGASRGAKGTRYLNYRCDNKQCIRNDKSQKPRIKAGLRGTFVFKFISEFLEGGLNFTKKEHEQYQQGFKRLNEEQIKTLRLKQNSFIGALKSLNTEINKLSLSLANLSPEEVAWKQTNKRVNELATTQNDLERKVESIKEMMTKQKQTEVSLEQFLNISKIASTKIESADGIAKDKICRFIFLNLSINEHTVVDFELKEPFKTLLAERKESFLSGSGHGRN